MQTVARWLGTLFLCASITLLVGAPTVLGEGEGEGGNGAPAGTPEGGGTPAGEGEEPKERTVGEVRVDLDKRFDELNGLARTLADDYQALIRRRVDELIRTDSTMHHLNSAGIFTHEYFTGGLPEDPLARLPWLRRKLDSVDKEAEQLAIQFGGTAKEQNYKVARTIMKKIHEAQTVYRDEDRDGNGIRDYADSLKKLAREGLFDRTAGDEFVSSGYKFKILFGDVMKYSASAGPEKGAESGVMFYYIDHTGVLRESKGRTATERSGPAEGEKDPKAPGK